MAYGFKWKSKENEKSEVESRYIEVIAGEHKGLRGYILQGQPLINSQCNYIRVILYKGEKSINATISIHNIKQIKTKLKSIS